MKTFSREHIATKDAKFAIGALSENWVKKSTKYHAALFQNQKDGATITVGSWCRDAYDDSPLDVLSTQINKALAGQKIISSQTKSVSGRDVLFTSLTGNLDGAEVFLRTAVLKRENCVFDFFYVSVPDAIDSVSDFDSLVEGFKPLRGFRP